MSASTPRRTMPWHRLHQPRRSAACHRTRRRGRRGSNVRRRRRRTKLRTRKSGYPWRSCTDAVGVEWIRIVHSCRAPTRTGRYASIGWRYCATAISGRDTDSLAGRARDSDRRSTSSTQPSSVLSHQLRHKRRHQRDRADCAWSEAKSQPLSPMMQRQTEIPQYSRVEANSATDWSEVSGSPDVLSDIPTKCVFCRSTIEITLDEPLILAAESWNLVEPMLVGASHRKCMRDALGGALGPSGA